MSILCDTSIIERCDPKAEVFDPAKYEVERFKYLRAFIESSEAERATLAGADDDYQSLNDSLEALRLNCYRPRTIMELERFKPMVAPFFPRQIRKVYEGDSTPLECQGRTVLAPAKITREIPIISRGLTSYGYDVSLAPEFKVFSNINSGVIDPKRLDPKCLVDVAASYDPDTGESYVIMPPNSYLLGRTEEYFVIPRDIMVICLGKSTYARSGGIVNVTPIEPGFEGNVVIEISNSTNLPAKVYAHEGIAQFMFFKGDLPCRESYGDRKGKYQGQTGITLPKV